ncbi:MAG TPA: hypothetical protein PLT82_01550 [Candidatus Hydrogenedens sp.]|nr:hypothetical protein [Candidatus Hydrogenedens sp.]HOL19024.1 hypothetical protein [Candidatus Hydrogenedens sp.]HPP57794.1 hypothetical protein [Candidatus Hydrogenedens sp.]
MAHIKLGIITGSGLDFSNILDTCHSKRTFAEIFPKFYGNIKGHSYQILEGTLHSIPTLICNGRIHLYEGYTSEHICEFLLYFKEKGVSHLILINAVGGLKNKFPLPSFIAIHRITPITYHGIKLPNELIPSWIFNNYHNNGTYIWVVGPNYETKSELRLFLEMGGDVVGMSGAPELYWSLKHRIKTAMFSCITNYCFDSSILTHEHVINNAQIGCYQFLPRLKQLIIDNI